MSEAVSTPLKLFYCYAHEDKALRDALDSHLISLKRQKLIEVWYDGKISPGTDREREINTYLHSADIVLLLISSDFLSSDYAYSKEMAHALERDKAGTVRVVPILLRPVDWQDEPFSKLQILPTGKKAVTRWTNPDDAYEDIARALRGVVKDLQAQREAPVEQSPDKHDNLYDHKQDKEALEVYEEQSYFDPNAASAYYQRGNALYELKQYEEALGVYDEVMRHFPLTLAAYLACTAKGNALYELKRYGEALEAYEDALSRNPTYYGVYNDRGNALYALKRYEEALEMYEEALRLNPTDAIVYSNRGVALHELKWYEEALEAYQEALHLDPDCVLAYENMALTLDILGRTKEAQQAREKARQLGFS